MGRYRLRDGSEVPRGALQLDKPGRGCGVGEMATTARSIREVKGLVINAYMTNRTNAYAENVNERTKDVKRRSCGFTKCENMRRRLLIAFGSPQPGEAMTLI